MPRFDGSDYLPPRDDPRLSPQYYEIFNLMIDGRKRSLATIEAMTGYPQASISAQLRHMRKRRFGSYIVNKEYRGDGLYVYWVLQPDPDQTRISQTTCRGCQRRDRQIENLCRGLRSLRDDRFWSVDMLQAVAGRLLEDFDEEA